MNDAATQGPGRDLKELATAIFKAGLAAVDPERCVQRHLRMDGDVLHVGGTPCDLEAAGRRYLIGFGKASAAMARAAEALLGRRVDDGLIITKYGHGLPLKRCRVMEAGHPVPDENGLLATSALLDLVSTAGPDDLILCMISGGGSALTPAPAPGLRLADKQETTRLLLACGADIHEINTLRKHLSRIKGGQLCRCAGGARIISLILSDVVGDDLDIIASGATAPDPATFGDCVEILSRYGLMERIPEPVRRRLDAGCDGRIDETPKPGNPVFDRVDNRIVGSISDALAAAEAEAGRLGFHPLVLTSTIQGEAREVARVLCAVAGEVRRSGRPAAAPACLLSGGETTVTLKGDGKGGRNMELALSAALDLSGRPGVLLLSAGTDGTDGPTDAAGAFADGATVSRAAALNLSARRHLADNNAYAFFQPLGDLLVTGPTRTNVMDLQVVLIDP
jgi:hydroxypyruvate reductase